MTKRAEVVLVEWADAAASASDWEDGTKPPPPTRTIVQSVGFVSHRTDDIIQLVQNTAEDSHKHALDILLCAVVSITPMRYGKKQPQ